MDGFFCVASSLAGYAATVHFVSSRVGASLSGGAS